MKKLNINALFTIFLVCSILVIFIYANNKKDFFTDEIYSFGLSNSQEKTFIDNNYVNTGWVRSDFFWKYITVQEDQRFDYKSVWVNQKNDVHPPLYYALLHTICSIFPDKFSKWFGIVINLPFYILAQVLLFKIGKRFLPPNKELLPCILWGGCALGISTVIFIRMYMMVAFFILLLSYSFINIYIRNTITARDYLALFVSILGGILTQYYFLIYFAILAIVFLIIAFVKKEWPLLIHSALIAVGAGFIALITFPDMITHIFYSYRGQEAISNTSSLNLSQITKYWLLLDDGLFGGFFSILLLLTLILLIAKYVCSKVFSLDIGTNEKVIEIKICRNHKNFIPESMSISISRSNLALISVGISAISYFLIVAQIAPACDKDSNRYMYPIYPLIILLIVIALNKILYKYKNTNRLVSILLIAGALLSHHAYGVSWLYEDSTQYWKIVSADKGKDCIYICDTYTWFDIYRNLLMLLQYDEVYLLDINNCENIEEILTTRESSDEVLVYLQEKYSNEQVYSILENLVNNSDFKGYAYKYNYYASVYELQY